MTNRTGFLYHRALVAATGLAGLLTLTPGLALADPLNPDEPVLEAVYDSPLKDYVPDSDFEIGGWKAANKRVGEIGGWRTYLEQAQQAGESARPGDREPAEATDRRSTDR